MGLDVAIEALKDCLRQKKANVSQADGLNVARLLNTSLPNNF